MKLKCTKCDRVVNKRKEVFDDQVQFLGITPEKYKMFYLCRCCREYTFFDWLAISSHPNLLQHLDFIEKYKDKLRWWKLCEEQRLPESFIEKYEQYVDWMEVYEHQNPPEEFIEKHADEVNWNAISKYQKLSPEFITKHIDKITAEILKNEEFDNYPDSIKLLLKQKFGQ